MDRLWFHDEVLLNFDEISLMVSHFHDNYLNQNWSNYPGKNVVSLSQAKHVQEIIWPHFVKLLQKSTNQNFYIGLWWFWSIFGRRNSGFLFVIVLHVGFVRENIARISGSMLWFVRMENWAWPNARKPSEATWIKVKWEMYWMYVEFISHRQCCMHCCSRRSLAAILYFPSIRYFPGVVFVVVTIVVFISLILLLQLFSDKKFGFFFVQLGKYHLSSSETDNASIMCLFTGY